MTDQFSLCDEGADDHKLANRFVEVVARVLDRLTTVLTSYCLRHRVNETSITTAVTESHRHSSIDERLCLRQAPGAFESVINLEGSNWTNRRHQLQSHVWWNIDNNLFGEAKTREDTQPGPETGPAPSSQLIIGKIDQRRYCVERTRRSTNVYTMTFSWTVVLQNNYDWWRYNYNGRYIVFIQTLSIWSSRIHCQCGCGRKPSIPRTVLHQLVQSIAGKPTIFFRQESRNEWDVVKSSPNLMTTACFQTDCRRTGRSTQQRRMSSE